MAMTTPVRHDLSDPAIPEGMVRITRDGRHRFVWPVHLGGWQALGWQLQPAREQQPAEPRLPVESTNTEPAPMPAIAPEPEPWLVPDAAQEPAGATDFQAMTKAQIIEHCSSAYGAELDGSQTKAELIEQATALEQNAAAEAATTELIEPVPGSGEPLPDALLDDPLI